VRVIGYVRTSTEAQANGLRAQKAALRDECDRRGWELVDVICDEAVSRASLERPGLRAAMQRMEAGDATGLMVVAMDRLGYSVPAPGRLLAWFAERQATLVALDLGVDTSTPAGRLVANVIAAVAEWERDAIADRTRAGMAALRAQGKPTGRPAVADQPELAARIRTMRDNGMSLQAIADAVNTESVPTMRGAVAWRRSSVQTAAGYRRPTRRGL
jgi:DNA invertase Pin-like site-specific DNA recombinase